MRKTKTKDSTQRRKGAKTQRRKEKTIEPPRRQDAKIRERRIDDGAEQGGAGVHGGWRVQRGREREQRQIQRALRGWQLRAGLSPGTSVARAGFAGRGRD